MGCAMGGECAVPNTWHLMAAIVDRPERRVAVQEYGKSNEELLAALSGRGCVVTPVRVYQWALPEDTTPLREAARRLAAGALDVLCVDHFHAVAASAPDGRRGRRSRSIAKRGRSPHGDLLIGPTTSESLEDLGLRADMEPTAPKMGILVKEAGEQAGDIIARKRGH